MKIVKENFIKIVFLKFFFLAIFFAPNNHANAVQIENLNILAEPNMVGALTKIARIYSQKSAVIVSLSFANSAESITEVETGEPADVFIAAHPAWVSNLRQKGLIDIYSILHIASDSLVLVTSEHNANIPKPLLEKKYAIDKALKLLDSEGISNLVIDNHDSSLGLHSRELLNYLNSQNLKVYEKLSEDKTSLIDLITSDNSNYSIVLASQIKDKKNLKVLSSQNSHDVFYQALVIAGDNMENAREFIRFMQTAQAKKILIEEGFYLE